MHKILFRFINRPATYGYLKTITKNQMSEVKKAAEQIRVIGGERNNYEYTPDIERTNTNVLTGRPEDNLN